MKVTGPNQYEVTKGDRVRVTVTAVGIPYNADYGSHINNAIWTIVQEATATVPTQIQEFVAQEDDDRFHIFYGFGPAPAEGAHYLRTVECVPVKDGPSPVQPIDGISTLTVPYTFTAAKPTVKKAARKIAAINKHKAPKKKKSKKTAKEDPK